MDFRRIRQFSFRRNKNCIIQFYILNQQRFSKVKRLVKNNKGIFEKTWASTHNASTFLAFFRKNPNFHQIHITTKIHKSK